MPLLTWKWFLIASAMTAGLLHKVGAPAFTIACGIIVAAAVTWRYGGRR